MHWQHIAAQIIQGTVFDVFDERIGTMRMWLKKDFVLSLMREELAKISIAQPIGLHSAFLVALAIATKTRN